MSIVALAKDLNLSISTVSRSLNGYLDVSAATRERIANRAAEIGYRANPVARRLKSGKANAVGVVLPAPGASGAFIEGLYSQILGGAAKTLEQAGYQLLATTQPGSDSDAEIDFYKSMMQRGWVDALIIVRTRTNDPRVLFAQQSNFPFVTLGRTENTEPYAWVDTDNEAAFFQAVMRQVQRGRHRIALLNGMPEFNFARLRERGYLHGLQEAGIPCDLRLIRHGNISEQDGFKLCEQLLKEPDRPDAILCATDDMAVGAIAACRAVGLQPGRDIGITGYGNTAAAAYASPPISSIDHSPYRLGEILGSLLLKRLKGADPATLSHLEPVKFIARVSD